MVNDLLYMAQMQAGYGMRPAQRTVELDSLLLDVFALGRSIAALKEQKVVLMHEDIAATIGDRDQLSALAAQPYRQRTQVLARAWHDLDRALGRGALGTHRGEQFRAGHSRS